jgi:flagellar motor component MotA
MPVFGAFLILFVIFAGIYNGGSLENFIDAPAILVVGGITMGSLMVARISIKTMIKTLFKKNTSREQIQIAVAGWAQARTFVMASGWIGLLMYAMTVGHHLTYVKSIGPAVTLLLITLFYATVLSYTVFLPIQLRLERRLSNLE